MIEAPASLRPDKPEAAQPWLLPPRAVEAQEEFQVPLLRLAQRLGQWLIAALDYGKRRWRAGRSGDTSAATRGVLLRETLERMGGTFVKLGQQLSTRLDLLPFDTCQELAKMLDRMPAFPPEQAIAAIERATGKPLAETFSAFDPDPLGSASIACVYHAFLRSGEEVAVKVRRPGIGELFSADLKAIDLLGSLAEFLTLIRPGLTRALRVELRTMLLEELDFRSEARFQDLFRERAKKDKQHVTAPRVYPEYCSKDVMVSEFVRGVWLQDLLAAKEGRDEAALDYCERLDISPARVARRLLHTLYWSNFENLFYHADPHPANILVRPGNELVLIDFGAVGPTTHRNSRNYTELFRRQASHDLDGMVQVFANIVSPLPPVDINALRQEGLRLTANWQYGFESKHAQWWERSSAGMWIGMLEMTRKFQIPINIDTVRLVRSSLLYDTIAARLDDSISIQVEFEKYRHAAQQRVTRGGFRRAAAELDLGRPQAELARAANLGGRLMYQLRDFADGSMASPLDTVSKTTSLVSRLMSLVAAISTFTIGAASLAWLTGSADSTAGMVGRLEQLGASPLYWVVVVLMIWRSYRATRFVLEEIDPQAPVLPAWLAVADRLALSPLRR